jgi:DNA-binding MarR family transcriptional regulator
MAESTEPARKPSPNDRQLSWLREHVVSTVRSNDPDLSLRQLGVLLICHTSDHIQTVRGLAGALGIHKPAVTRAVDALEKFKLVHRLPDPKDKRSVIIKTTQNGGALCRRFVRAV